MRTTTTPNLSQESNYSAILDTNNISDTQPLSLDLSNARYLNLCAVANEESSTFEESLQMDDLLNDTEESTKNDEVFSDMVAEVEAEDEVDDSSYCSTEDNGSDDG